MRTTVRLDDDLLREAKETAARTGRTLTEVIEDALRQSLRSVPREATSKPFHIQTSGHGGLRPGVDLDDSAALVDLMEER